MSSTKPATATNSCAGLEGIMELFKNRLLRKAYRPGVREEQPKEVLQCEADFREMIEWAIEMELVNRQLWSDTCEKFSNAWPHVCHWLHPGRLADHITSNKNMNVKFEGVRPHPVPKEERISKPTVRAKKYYCAECNVVCNSLGQFDVHEKGKKHLELLASVSKKLAKSGHEYKSPSPMPCEGTADAFYYVEMEGGTKTLKPHAQKQKSSAGAKLVALASLAVTAAMQPTDESMNEVKNSWHTNVRGMSATENSAWLEDNMWEENDDDTCSTSSDHSNISSISEYEIESSMFTKTEEDEILYPLQAALESNKPIPEEFCEKNSHVAAVAWLQASMRSTFEESDVKRHAELACSTVTPSGMEKELGKMMYSRLQSGPHLRSFSSDDLSTYADDADEWVEEQNDKEWIQYAQTFATEVHLAVRSAVPTKYLANAIPSFISHLSQTQADTTSSIPKAAQTHISSAFNAIEEGVNKLLANNYGEQLSTALSSASDSFSRTMMHRSVRNALQRASEACATARERAAAMAPKMPTTTTSSKKQGAKVKPTAQEDASTATKKDIIEPLPAPVVTEV
eukprot:TRINITY_DN16699_c0_g2_i3.p1 TRINITY_DN16699_c0_g2~~TRINITY_DN16699_c0_g2_i3.p1  ORF type:complete len:584 (+),score=155.02 TRINITY_DN16699_c0_g2_i3:48-1754(+)